MKKILADTNVFLRLLLNDIPSQNKQVKNLLIKAKNKKIQVIVPSIVIFEIQFVLEKYYGFGKDEVLDKIRHILSTSYLDIESRQTFIEAASFYKDRNLSFVDCFLIAKAKLEKLELFSFDKKLSR